MERPQRAASSAAGADYSEPHAPTGKLSLEDAAREVNQALRKENDLRLRAAYLLFDLKRRIENGEAGNITWEAWCKKNIQRHFRDVQRLTAIAASEKPEEALAKERAKAAEGMRRSRGAANVKHPINPDKMKADFEAAKKAVLKLPKCYRIRVEQWLHKLNA